MSSTRLLKVLIPTALGIGAIYGLYQISKVNPKTIVLKNPDEEKRLDLTKNPLSITPRAFRIEDNAIYLSENKKMSLALVRALYQLIPDGHKYFPSIFQGLDATFFNDYIMMVKINRLYKSFKDLGIDGDDNQLMLVNIFLVNGMQYPFSEIRSEDSDLYVATIKNSMNLNTKAWNQIRTHQLLSKVDNDEINSPTSNDKVRDWVIQTLQLLLQKSKINYEELPEKTKINLKKVLSGDHVKDSLTYEEYKNILEKFYQSCDKNCKNHSPQNSMRLT